MTQLNQLRQKIVLSLALAAFVYLALALYADAHKLADAFLHWDWRWLPVAILAVLLNYGLRAARWHYFLHVIGIRNVPLPSSLLIFLSGFSLTMVPGKLGELFKSVLLKSHYNIPITLSAPIVAVERLTDLMGMTFLAAIGISIFPLGLPALAVVLVFLFAIVALIQSRAIAERLIDLLGRLPLIGKFAHLAQTMYESAYLLLRLRPLAVAFALSTVAWLGECVALWLVLLGFGLPPTPDLLLQSTFIYASASIFGAATLMPGGLGTTEGSMTSLIQFLVPTTAAIAAAATLIVRVSTLWFAVILGAIAVLIFGQIKRTTNPLAHERS